MNVALIRSVRALLRGCRKYTSPNFRVELPALAGVALGVRWLMIMLCLSECRRSRIRRFCLSATTPSRFAGLNAKSVGKSNRRRKSCDKWSGSATGTSSTPLIPSQRWGSARRVWSCRSRTCSSTAKDWNRAKVLFPAADWRSVAQITVDCGDKLRFKVIYFILSRQSRLNPRRDNKPRFINHQRNTNNIDKSMGIYYFLLYKCWQKKVNIATH